MVFKIESLTLPAEIKYRPVRSKDLRDKTRHFLNIFLGSIFNAGFKTSAHCTRQADFSISALLGSVSLSMVADSELLETVLALDDLLSFRLLPLLAFDPFFVLLSLPSRLASFICFCLSSSVFFRYAH